MEGSVPNYVITSNRSDAIARTDFTAVSSQALKPCNRPENNGNFLLTYIAGEGLKQKRALLKHRGPYLTSAIFVVMTVMLCQIIVGNMAEVRLKLATLKISRPG